MTAQRDQHHDVFAMWPGRMKLNSKSVQILQQGKVEGVISCEVVNPLPVALDEGVVDFDAYMAACEGKVYEDFLKRIKPDVIHIHTLMGLHREFIDAAERCGIKTVFTSHDYYGICPKVTLYCYGKVCENDNGCKNCVQCNCSALSVKKIMLMQSPLYRQLKNSALVKFLRNRHRGAFFGNEELPAMPVLESEADKLALCYQQLRQYYIGMLSKIDLIHFNSTVAQEVYSRYFTPKASCVVSITHRDIGDHRDLPRRKGDCLRITCLAPAKPFKGYNVMKQALDELWASGKRDFVLQIFSQVPEPAPYMQVQEDGFNYAMLEQIMADTDVLMAPSVWYETFGFTVLEALSYGVPVIVSDNVGAKDVVEDGGLVVKAGSVTALKEAVLRLTSEELAKMRENVRQNVQIKTWSEFLEENERMYR